MGWGDLRGSKLESKLENRIERINIAIHIYLKKDTNKNGKRLQVLLWQLSTHTGMC